MKVGYSKTCISPKNKEFYLIGYKSPYRFKPAEGIHDDIYCQTILMEISNKLMYIVSFDFLELEQDMVEDIKTRLYDCYGINRDLVLLTVTHNHSSIMSYHKNWHSGIFDQSYYDFVVETVLTSYRDCLDKMQVVSLVYGKETITGYFSNRNHKGKLADNEVSVTKFVNDSNQCVASIVNWAVHSTVLSAKNNTLTSDLAGNVSKKLEEKWGVSPLMIVGAAADCSNRHERLGDDFEELERVSTALADHISRISVHNRLELNEIQYQTLSHTIHHNMIKFHEVIEDFLQSDSPLKNQGLIDKCQEQLKINSYQLDLSFEVIHLGEMQIITFPGELGSKFGRELKNVCKTLGVEGIIAGYTNGFNYYFMPKEEYGLSFETIGNPVPPGEPEKIVEKMKQSSVYLAKVDAYNEIW